MTQTITFDEGIKGYILTALCLTVNKLGLELPKTDGQAYIDMMTGKRQMGER